MENKGEIIMYQPDEEVRLEVRMEDETVWLTQAQMAELFQTQTTPQNITIHIRSIYKEHELEKLSTCKDYLQVRHRLQFPILQHRRSRCQSTIIRNNDRKQPPYYLRSLEARRMVSTAPSMPTRSVLTTRSYSPISVHWRPV